MLLPVCLLLLLSDAPRFPTAERQLAHARTVRTTPGVSPEAALEAYRAVVRAFPERRAACAESWFRTGEILRASGRPREAGRAFERAFACGLGTPFRARARLELAHLERRAGRIEAALDAYVALWTDDEAEHRTRDLAGLWAGRMRALAGRIGEARRTLELVARRAERPVVRIRAFDHLARLWCERGDPGEALAVVVRCRRELSEHAREVTELGAAVRRALARMRVLECLEIDPTRAKDPRGTDR